MVAVASGLPTKNFFVGMLTRDIEINDAILDLLDNCLDGVVRSKSETNKLTDNNFYRGYYANITINSSSFSIEDNCGGIPRNIAEKYAFRMGREPSQSDNLPTVGVYGIGMKRAIFKIGKEAAVHTKTSEGKYTVVVPSDWACSDEWDFPIDDIHDDNNLENLGTKVTINLLNPDISNLWEDVDRLTNFIDDLKRYVKESYSRIVEKGFKISINGSEVDYSPVELLFAQIENGIGIRPYLFTAEYDDVKVKVAIGFYAPPPTDDEIDEMNDTRRRSSDAGITIVCNDRVVLYNDKSNLTGWGINGVPHYHTQFIGIKGIAVFESNNASKLPMTTTKRGVDHSSSIYISVKERICEGLKTFTNYTNKWKGQNNLERKYSYQAAKTSYEQFFDSNKGVEMNKAREGMMYKPKLPSPPNDKPYRIIRYSRSVSDIKTLTEYFYKDPDFEIKPSEIGEKSFDEILKTAAKGK